MQLDRCLPRLLADCIAKADLVFLLDSSSSVGSENFRDMLDFVAGVLQDADIDDGQIRVGAMTFGCVTRCTKGFCSDPIANTNKMVREEPSGSSLRHPEEKLRLDEIVLFCAHYILPCSTESRVSFHLKDYTSKFAVLNALRGISYVPGSSNMADGLQTLRTSMFNPANGDRDVSTSALGCSKGCVAAESFKLALRPTSGQCVCSRS